MKKSKQPTTSALTDAYHNEPVLWDTASNANRGAERAGMDQTIAGMFNTHIGKC